MIRYFTLLSVFLLFASADLASAQTSELCGLEIDSCVEIEIDLSAQAAGGQSIEDTIYGGGAGLELLIQKGYDESCNMNSGFNSGTCRNSILDFHFVGDLLNGDINSNGQAEYYGEATFTVGYSEPRTGYNNSSVVYSKIHLHAGVRYRKTPVEHTVTVVLPVVMFSGYSGRKLGVDVDVLLSTPLEDIPEEYEPYLGDKESFVSGGGGGGVVTYDYDNGVTLRTEGRFMVYGRTESLYDTYLDEEGYELSRRFFSDANSYLFNASLMKGFFNDRLSVSLGTEYEAHRRSYTFRSGDEEFDALNARTVSRSMWRTYLSGSVRIW